MNDFKIETNPKIATGFKTPDNYFDDFSSRLLAKLPVEDAKVISFYGRNKNWFYSAAAILVIAFTIPIMNIFNENTDENFNTEVEYYISNHSTITDDDIVNLLDDDDIATLKQETSLDDATLENAILEDSNIENYITN